MSDRPTRIVAVKIASNEIAYCPVDTFVDHVRGLARLLDVSEPKEITDASKALLAEALDNSAYVIEQLEESF